MAGTRFLEDDAHEHVKHVVHTIEQQSSAEIVVAVRERSWRYRHAHFLFGFIVALLLLCALLFLPQPFDILYWPLEITGAFVLGAAICMNVPPLERLFATQRVIAEQVERAGKAAFFDLGVSYTRERSGLLIYVSVAERRLEIVADAGIDKALTMDGFQKAKAAMGVAVERSDFDAFLTGMQLLAAPLAAALPRGADDRNELADEVA